MVSRYGFEKRESWFISRDFSGDNRENLRIQYSPEKKTRFFPNFQILKMKGRLGFECEMFVDLFQRFTF
jgi:hypothetical protein